MEQLDLLKTTYKVKIENVETGVEAHAVVEVFKDDPEVIHNNILRATSDLMRGVLDMNEKKEDEKQKQDLAHQKPEETDNLQKSARPDRSYCEDRGLDQDTLGKKD